MGANAAAASAYALARATANVFKQEPPLTSTTLEQLHAAHSLLLKALERAKRHANDVLEPPAGEDQSIAYLVRTLMDDAHEILDLAHAFKNAVEAHNG